jgi:DNA modification methylase
MAQETMKPQQKSHVTWELLPEIDPTLWEAIKTDWQLPDIEPMLWERLLTEARRWGRIIMPIIIDKCGKIIDGKYRLAVGLELGYRDIPTIIVRGLSEEDKRDLRLIINGCRRHLTREQVRQWIEWELAKDPFESNRAIAGRLGVSHATVGKVRGGGQDDHLVSPSQTSRRGKDGNYYSITYANTDRQREEALHLYQQVNDPPTGNVTIRKLRTAKFEQVRAERIASAKPVTIKGFKIHACDFRNIGQRIKDIDLAVCDPPWTDYKTLAIPLGETLCRVLKPNGLAALYLGDYTGDEWNDRLRSAGLHKVCEVIALHEPPGTIKYGIRQLHTNIKIYRNRPYTVSTFPRILPNVIEAQGPAEKGKDKWQQPVYQSVHLIEYLSNPGARLCDLTVGSGTVGIATAIVGQGRTFVGCDIRPEIIPAAMADIAKALRESTT